MTLNTCKREAPRNDGDTRVVSTAGTPILKSAMAPLAGPDARNVPVGSATWTPSGRSDPRLASAEGPIGWCHVPLDPAQWAVGFDR
ncbi:hypothetical protein TIFTF001_033429 [Ficus carica]|uniref:Uncharacterized protein n=1 Tax=Ficus carica TaxID=3494 RepID=A0AA88DYV1_FICCA|nr:hypothetical protein TIFTF001_033429 [Ficus carica]